MLNRSGLTADRLPFDDLNEFAEGEGLNGLNSQGYDYCFLI